MPIFQPFAFRAESGPPPAPLLLDTYTGADGAWSVRQLSNSYTGDCLKMYRDSDGATLDFGFDGTGYLDVPGIESWLAGSDGYVDIWYDQSGNGRDMNLGTSGTRAKIATAGTVSTLTGKASMERTNAVGYDLGFQWNTGDKTLIVCCTNYSNYQPTTGAARVVSTYPGTGGVGTSLLVDFFPTAGFRVFEGGTGAYYPNSSVSNDAVIAGYTKTSGTVNGTYNGGTSGTNRTGLSNTDAYNLRVFEDRGAGSNVLESPAGMSELVLWSSALALSDISDDLNAFYSTY